MFLIREQKNNLFSIISYILEILLVLLFALFFRQPLFSVLIIVLLIMPFISIYVTYREKDLLDIDIENEMARSEGDEKLNFYIIINHKGHIPLLNCKVDAKIDNLFYKNDRVNDIVFPGETGRENRIAIPISVSHAGLVEVSLNNLYITDYLHLYTFKRELKLSESTLILPKTREIDFDIMRAKKSDAEDEEIDSMYGELSRDIRDIREYKEGDRLRDIHFKLTARTGEIMVKEFERKRELNISLRPILLKDDSLQDTLSTFFSLSKKLLQEHEPFFVITGEDVDLDEDREKVSSYDELIAAYRRLCRKELKEKGEENTAINSFEQASVIKIIGREIIV